VNNCVYIVSLLLVKPIELYQFNSVYYEIRTNVHVVSTNRSPMCYWTEITTTSAGRNRSAHFYQIRWRQWVSTWVRKILYGA